MSDEPLIHHGLEGVVVETTSISNVIPEINSLVYRGYPVQELAEGCSFEEVAWLIWHGELPTRDQLQKFSHCEASRRDLNEELLNLIRACPKTAHPMDVLRTAVSFLGTQDESLASTALDSQANLERSISLMARIPTIIAAFSRFRDGLELIAPRKDLGFAANFLYLISGKVPPPEVVKAFEVSLVLYAEHGFNASTFTTRVVVSSLSDIYSGVVAGIASLKGSLHGGANEAVMNMLLEIGEPAKAKAWIRDALANKKVVMGFGHRVYKNGDSRVPTMKKYARAMAEFTHERKWLEIEDILEEVMFAEKHLKPNLDYPSGAAYHMMGLKIDLFTPIFVMARITGWTAHIMEQLANNRLIRPLSKYIGSGPRNVVPIQERK